MKEGDVIKASDDLALHLIECCGAPCHTETELRCPPILLDEVELAVVFWVEIADMAVRFDQLLKLGLLGDEIGLHKKDPPAATVSAARGTTKTWALGEKVFILLGPQTTFPNDDLHALEPTGHGGMVFRKIERLRLAVWKRAAAHAWTVRVVRPPFLRACEISKSVGMAQRGTTAFAGFVDPQAMRPCPRVVAAAAAVVRKREPSARTFYHFSC